MDHTSLRIALGAGALLLAALLTATTAEARGGRGRGGRGGGGGDARQGGQALQDRFEAITPVALTGVEIAKVTYLREEEKLARDVYRTLGQQWSLQIFANIGAAEQRHMDHLLLIFNLYELTDPVTDDTVGVFTDESLGTLYDTLVAQGSASLVAALQVGAQIEDLDIDDIHDLLEATSNDHIRLVAQNLVKGSRNHLRAFMRSLQARDATYTPTHLSQSEFDAILAGDQERGPVDENGDAVSTGRGQGERGQGRRGQGQGNGRGGGRGQCDGTGPKGQGNGNGRGRGRGRGRGQGNDNDDTGS